MNFEIGSPLWTLARNAVMAAVIFFVIVPSADIEMLQGNKERIIVFFGFFAAIEIFSWAFTEAYRWLKPRLLQSGSVRERAPKEYK